MAFNPFKRSGDDVPAKPETVQLFGAPYKPHIYPELVFKYCLLGATNARLAELLDVEASTIVKWMAEYPLFRRSIIEGRDMADAEVAHSLFKCATGYTREEVKIFQFKGVPVVVPYTAYYAPDVAAQKHWLAVRRKQDKEVTWRDVQTVDVEARQVVETKQISADATPEQAADMYKRMLG